MSVKKYIMMVLLGSVAGCGRAKDTEEVNMQPEILYKYTKNLDTICAVFPKTAQEVQERATKLIAQARRSVDEIIAVPDKERTFDNTARALDTVGSNFMIQSSAIATLGYISPDDTVREAANKAEVQISQAAVDIFGQNLKIVSSV